MDEEEFKKLLRKQEDEKERDALSPVENRLYFNENISDPIKINISFSKDMKQMLEMLEKMEKEGFLEMDDFGFGEHVESTEAPKKRQSKPFRLNIKFGLPKRSRKDK